MSPLCRGLLLLLLLLARRLAWRLVQKLQGHVTHKKDDMFGRQRKKQEGQQRHKYEVANNYLSVGMPKTLSLSEHARPLHDCISLVALF